MAVKWVNGLGQVSEPHNSLGLKNFQSELCGMCYFPEDGDSKLSIEEICKREYGEVPDESIDALSKAMARYGSYLKLKYKNGYDKCISCFIKEDPAECYASRETCYCKESKDEKKD